MEENKQSLLLSLQRKTQENQNRLTRVRQVVMDEFVARVIDSFKPKGENAAERGLDKIRLQYTNHVKDCSFTREEVPVLRKRIKNAFEREGFKVFEHASGNNYWSDYILDIGISWESAGNEA